MPARENHSVARGAKWNWKHVLMLIILSSLTLRIVSALFQGNTIEVLPGVYDQYSYDSLARRVLSGHGLSFGEDWWPVTRANEPTAHWSYLYTLYLAVVYRLFGENPLSARLIQALVSGVLHPWLTWRVGSRLFGVKAGLIAAGVTALYSYFVFYSGALMTEAFYILSVLWVLQLAIAIKTKERAASRSTWIRLGLALGIAVLLRQVFLLFVPVLFLWLSWRRGQEEGGLTVRKEWLGGVLIASVTLAVMILPWTVRNHFAFGRFVLLNTNAGYAFYWSNHPIHGAEFIPILRKDGPSYRDLLPPSLLGLNEAALDRELLSRGLRFVADNPARFLLLSLSRAEEYFKFWPSPQSSRESNLARVFSFGLVLPFMLLGLWISAAQLLARRTPEYLPRKTPDDFSFKSVTIVYLFVITYSLIHLLSWALIRYRLPVDAALMPFAAVGILSLTHQLKTLIRRRKAAIRPYTKTVDNCIMPDRRFSLTGQNSLPPNKHFI